jgi:hypothetical protein
MSTASKPRTPFLGTSIVTDFISQPASQVVPAFRVFERVGTTIYLDDGERPIRLAQLQPLTKREDLQPGAKILVTLPMGNMTSMTVNETCTAAESEVFFVSLEFTPGDGIPGGFGDEWVANGCGNKAALARVDFK